MWALLAETPQTRAGVGIQRIEGAGKQAFTAKEIFSVVFEVGSKRHHQHRKIDKLCRLCQLCQQFKGKYVPKKNRNGETPPGDKWVTEHLAELHQAGFTDNDFYRKNLPN